MIGSFTVASTSQQTKTLSTSLAGYSYIIISQYALSDSYFGNATNVENCGVCGAPIDYFKSNPIKMVYRSNNGNGNTVFTYVSDTSMTVKANYANSRTYYVYGMK